MEELLLIIEEGKDSATCAPSTFWQSGFTIKGLKTQRMGQTYLSIAVHRCKCSDRNETKHDGGIQEACGKMRRSCLGETENI